MLVSCFKLVFGGDGLFVLVLWKGKEGWEIVTLGWFIQLCITWKEHSFEGLSGIREALA